MGNRLPGEKDAHDNLAYHLRGVPVGARLDALDSRTREIVVRALAYGRAHHGGERHVVHALGTRLTDPRDILALVGPSPPSGSSSSVGPTTAATSPPPLRGDAADAASQLV